MVLRPLDIVILLKIHCKGDQHWSQMSLAKELFISSRSVNEGLKRAAAARLYSPSRRQVNSLALEEALVHGARWFLPPEQGGRTRGVLTGWGAPPLSDQILASADDLRPVWPDASGSEVGLALKPLHSSVPLAVKEDRGLYEALSLVDALRAGRARERSAAARELSERLRK